MAYAPLLFYWLVKETASFVTMGCVQVNLASEASEVRDASVVAPVALTTPAQRFVLRSTDLSCLWIRIAVELRLRAAEQALVHTVIVGAARR